MSRRSWRVLFFALVLAAAIYSMLAPPSSPPRRDPVWKVPATGPRAEGLMVDNPTTRALSLRWVGASPGSTVDTLAVEYRAQGDENWAQALPLELVAEIDDLQLFAGRILNLQPGTSYDVMVHVPGTEGGEEVERAVVATRPEPRDTFDSTGTIHVYPDDSRVDPSGQRTLRLDEALREARPGELVLLHAGTYDGPFQAHVTGTADRPIVLRAAGDGEVLLRNPGGDVGAVITAEWGRDHLRWEGITFRVNGLGTAIKADESVGWAIRRCMFYGGIRTGASDWFIADNVLVGRYREWREYTRFPGGVGILIRGRGHVIEHNSVSYFWDGIVTTRPGGSLADALAADFSPTAIDINGNLIHAIVDDGIEVDRFVSNVSIERNRVINSFAGISLQESRPGPVYAIRNVVSNVLMDPWKIMQGSSGLRLFHNTTLNWLHATRLYPPELRNSTLLNNILLGFRFGLFVGSHDGRSRVDYNALRIPREGPPLTWSRDGGSTWQEFDDLEAVEAFGDQALGTHNLIIDETSDLAGAVRFDYREDVNPATLDMRLTPGSRAVDAGVRIATVNDTFAAEAPDLGAYELGSEVPHYGPRWTVGPEYRHPESLEPRATELAYVAEPVGVATMTLREWFVRFIDRHNLPVGTVLTAAVVLALVCVLGLGFVVLRRFRAT